MVMRPAVKKFAGLFSQSKSNNQLLLRQSDSVVLLLHQQSFVLRRLLVETVVLNDEENVEHDGEQAQTKLCRITENQLPLV